MIQKTGVDCTLLIYCFITFHECMFLGICPFKTNFQDLNVSLQRTIKNPTDHKFWNSRKMSHFITSLNSNNLKLSSPNNQIQMLISPDSIFRTSLHPTQIQQTKAHLTLAFQNSTHPTHLTQFWHSSKVLKQFDCFLPSFMVMNVSIDKFWRFPGTFLLLQAEDCRAWRIFYGSITLLSSLSKRSRVHVYSHDSYKLLYYERSKKEDFFCAIFFKIILGQQKLHTFWKKILTQSV